MKAIKVDRFYVNNLNRKSRFYYVLGKFGDNYDYILWDADQATIGYVKMKPLIDYTPFLLPEEGIEKFNLEKRFIRGMFTDDQRNK